jgi:hypothetical protein
MAMEKETTKYSGKLSSIVVEKRNGMNGALR